MTREIEILRLLLDRYERSGHCLPGRESNRRVALNMARGEYANYRENNPCTEEINQAVQALAAEGLITFSWRKGYENWLLDKVYLNLSTLKNAYARTKRTPLSATADALYSIVQQAAKHIQTPWKRRFLENEIERLQKNLRPSRLLPVDVAQAEAILKVLQYTEHGAELMRVISINCFHDSKYLEQNLLPQLASIARAYEPELVAYHALGDEYLTQNVVMEQIGILTYPEILEFCGNISLIFPSTTVNTSAFENGFCLLSENLRILRGIDASQIQTVLFVENRTNYRSLILQGIGGSTLLFYHGGFYSSTKRKLLRMLSDTVSPSAQTLFWGDIDLGGFLMFSRLKKHLFPKLVPWRMGLADFEEHKVYGIERSTAYLDLLQKKLAEKQFDPYFFSVASAILREKVSVEQEIML